jgi:hypothetical protein
MSVIPDTDSRNIPIRMRQDFIAYQLAEVDGFISPSRYLADIYVQAGIPREKMHVVWNGVDTAYFSRIQKKEGKGRIRFTFIGYFGRHKGIHILLEALPYIDEIQNVEINLIGSGEPLFTHYREEISTGKFRDTVRFWGRINDIRDAYRNTDVFILPSIWPENQPVTITEAMAAKIPVIASASGGIPELVADGMTGFLFKTGNPRHLAEKMNEFIKNPEIIREFGISGYEKIQGASLKHQVRKLGGVYDQLVQRPRTSSRRHPVVICHGKTVDAECEEVFRIFSKELDAKSIRFIMSDWLSEDQIKKGVLFWIVDGREDLQAGMTGLSHGLPLLVPERNPELKKVCVQFNCGLFYRDRLDAGAAIAYLVQNDRQRKQLAENGKKAFYSS